MLTAVVVCLRSLSATRSSSRTSFGDGQLVGDYRPEHIFTLRQSLGAYRDYQQLVPGATVSFAFDWINELNRTRSSSVRISARSGDPSKTGDIDLHGRL
jgi:hypothetical protein